MADISNLSIDDAIDRLLTVSVDSRAIEQYFNLFAYQGFDPKHVLGILMNIAKRESYDLIADMQTVLSFYVIRGSRYKTRKVIQKTDAEGLRRVRDVCLRYNIIDGTPNSKDDRNFARVSACFPTITAKILAQRGARVVGTKPDRLPTFLCFPAGCSLIPRTQGFEGLFNDWLTWAYSFDKVINSQSRGISPRNVLNYAVISSNSTLIPDDKRLRFLASMDEEFRKDKYSADFIVTPRRTEEPMEIEKIIRIEQATAGETREAGPSSGITIPALSQVTAARTQTGLDITGREVTVPTYKLT